MFVQNKVKLKKLTFFTLALLGAVSFQNKVNAMEIPVKGGNIYAHTIKIKQRDIPSELNFKTPLKRKDKVQRYAEPKPMGEEEKLGLTQKLRKKMEKEEEQISKFGQKIVNAIDALAEMLIENINNKKLKSNILKIKKYLINELIEFFKK